MTGDLLPAVSGEIVSLDRAAAIIVGLLEQPDPRWWAEKIRAYMAPDPADKHPLVSGDVLFATVARGWRHGMVPQCHAPLGLVGDTESRGVPGTIVWCDSRQWSDRGRWAVFRPVEGGFQCRLGAHADEGVAKFLEAVEPKGTWLVPEAHVHSAP